MFAWSFPYSPPYSSARTESFSRPRCSEVVRPFSRTTYYAARASEYDRIYQKPERQADLRQIETWLPSVLPGATVLEVACGTGYWTQFIAPVASAVVAIDSAPETLKIARQRVAASHVQFQVGDAFALAQTGRSFDAAFAGFWFSHVPLERQREFLIGLNSALTPGARVVLLDNLFVEGSSSAIVLRTLSMRATNQRRPEKPTAATPLKANAMANRPARAELSAPTVPVVDEQRQRTHHEESHPDPELPFQSSP